MARHELQSSELDAASSQRGGPVTAEIRILLVEDVAAEAELTLRQLRKNGIQFVAHRVDTESAMRDALRDFQPAVVLSDFTLPRFDGLSALKVAAEVAPEIPFIFVSGTIGEERAVEALRRGAVDYVLKTNLSRLAPAVNRALAEAAARGQIARLTRVLRMLSGINSAVVRIRDRIELLREACRLAVAIGGYATAMVLLKQPGTRSVQPVAWSDPDDQSTATLRTTVAESAAVENGTIRGMLKSGSPFVCNDAADLPAGVDFKAIMGQGGFRSLLALPLLIDKTPVGVLILAARAAGTVSDEELQMLREVAANLSFALQYLQKDSTVRFLSHFDPHTGLAKRPLFCERLARLLAGGANDHSRLAVAVIDIEQLSVINDSFGRHMGDLLLQHVADRLRRHFHDTELLAQLGGGTFAVALEAGRAEDLMTALHGHIAAVFGRPFDIEGRRIPLVAKSGVAYPEDGKDANALVQNAEGALRNARASGERHLPYSVARHSEAKARLALEHRLRTALERKQFELYYQPKVHVKTRRIVGVEALIRWNDPQSGVVSPAAFLPLVESTGLIVELGARVLEQAVRDCQHWQGRGLPMVRIAVNVSPIQLRRADFVARFFELTQPLAQIGGALDIEITEGALLDDSLAEVKKLKLLRAAGVRIAIDDFGTGYSSLSRLSELPIDTLKIDRTFISRLPHDRIGRTLVATIISLARSFELTVIAEGVETEDQLKALSGMDCDQAQGFLLSKPVPRDEMTGLLEHGRGHLMLQIEPSGDTPQT